jgi:hypothetical protein
MAYEFRKIATAGRRRLDPDTVRYRVVFWIPIVKRYRSRDDNRTSVLADVPEPMKAKDFELAAIRSGELEEVIRIMDFRGPQTADSLKARLLPMWEQMTLEKLREIPKRPWQSNTRHYRLLCGNPFEEITHVSR